MFPSRYLDFVANRPNNNGEGLGLLQVFDIYFAFGIPVKVGHYVSGWYDSLCLVGTRSPTVTKQTKTAIFEWCLKSLKYCCEVFSWSVYKIVDFRHPWQSFSGYIGCFIKNRRSYVFQCSTFLLKTRIVSLIDITLFPLF